MRDLPNTGNPSSRNLGDLRCASSFALKKLGRLLKNVFFFQVHKVEIPNFNEESDPTKMTPDQIRAKMREQGMLPPRPWQEKPMVISSTAGVFEAYVPPEGDGKLSAISLGVRMRRTFHLCNE